MGDIALAFDRPIPGLEKACTLAAHAAVTTASKAVFACEEKE